MDPRALMLSETSQRKTNTTWSHLHTESKENPTKDTTKPSSWIQITGWWLLDVGCVMGEMDEEDQKLPVIK